MDSQDGSGNTLGDVIFIETLTVYFEQDIFGETYTVSLQRSRSGTYRFQPLVAEVEHYYLDNLCLDGPYTPVFSDTDSHIIQILNYKGTAGLVRNEVSQQYISVDLVGPLLDSDPSQTWYLGDRSSSQPNASLTGIHRQVPRLHVPH